MQHDDSDPPAPHDADDDLDDDLDEDAEAFDEDASEDGEDASEDGEDASEDGDDASEDGEDASEDGDDASAAGEDDTPLHHRPGPFSAEADPMDAAHGIAPPLRSGRFEKRARAEAADDQARALVDRLLGLNHEVFARFEIADAEVAEAVQLARTVRKGGARARQARFVSQLIKGMTPAERAHLVEQVRAALEGKSGEVQLEKAWAAWRDHLVAHTDQGVNDLLAIEPDLDRQQLRTLARQAAKERNESKPPKAARQLYQVLRTALLEAPEPPPED